MFDLATRRALAVPLATAFLGGPWTEAAMARRARRALDGWAPWAPRLAGEVLAAYRRPPADRPRELVAYIVLVLAELSGREAPPRPRRYRVTEGQMGRIRWPVPEIPTLGALAAWLEVSDSRLEWLADVRGLERHVADERLRHYRYAWVPRRRGPPRLLEIPKAQTKAIQRRILHEILDWIPAHHAAHGFTRGRSARTHAAVHAGRAVVVCLDLHDFFAGVTGGRVYGIFRTAGYPEAVAHSLAGLCTSTTPHAVRARAHDPLRRRLNTPHLPQGAPTSPMLANLSAFGLDRRLRGLADATGAAYSRYADDLAFSGELHGAAPRLLRTTRTIARDEGFALHEAKTRFMTAAGRQRVTGAVVNAHPNVPREEYDALEALLHDAALHGAAAANRSGVGDLRAHVLGRISWVAALNPPRGARLHERFARVDWTP